MSQSKEVEIVFPASPGDMLFYGQVGVEQSLFSNVLSHHSDAPVTQYRFMTSLPIASDASRGKDVLAIYDQHKKSSRLSLAALKAVNQDRNEMSKLILFQQEMLRLLDYTASLFRFMSSEAFEHGRWDQKVLFYTLLVGSFCAFENHNQSKTDFVIGSRLSDQLLSEITVQDETLAKGLIQPHRVVIGEASMRLDDFVRRQKTYQMTYSMVDWYEFPLQAYLALQLDRIDVLTQYNEATDFFDVKLHSEWVKDALIASLIMNGVSPHAPRHITSFKNPYVKKSIDTASDSLRFIETQQDVLFSIISDHTQAEHGKLVETMAHYLSSFDSAEIQLLVFYTAGVRNVSRLKSMYRFLQRGLENNSTNVRYNELLHGLLEYSDSVVFDTNVISLSQFVDFIRNKDRFFQHSEIFVVDSAFRQRVQQILNLGKKPLYSINPSVAEELGLLQPDSISVQIHQGKTTIVEVDLSYQADSEERPDVLRFVIELSKQGTTIDFPFFESSQFPLPFRKETVELYEQTIRTHLATVLIALYEQEHATRKGKIAKAEHPPDIPRVVKVRHAPDYELIQARREHKRERRRRNLPDTLQQFYNEAQDQQKQILMEIVSVAEAAQQFCPPGTDSDEFAEALRAFNAGKRSQFKKLHSDIDGKNAYSFRFYSGSKSYRVILTESSHSVQGRQRFEVKTVLDRTKNYRELT